MTGAEWLRVFKARPASRRHRPARVRHRGIMAGMSDFQTLSGRPVVSQRSAEVWALARADYLAGAGAPEVCERHGLSLSTFRTRARRECWRRIDLPPSPPDAPFTEAGRPLLPVCSPQEALHTGETWAGAVELSDMVWLHLQRAVRAGRLIEARGWARVHHDLGHASAEGPPDRAANAPFMRVMQAKLDETLAHLAAFQFPE